MLAIGYFLLQPEECPPMIEFIDGHFLNYRERLTKATGKFVHHEQFSRLALVS